MNLNPEQQKLVLQFQQQEITGNAVYQTLAKRQKGKNRELLNRIAADEMAHYQIFKKITGRDVGANRLEVLKYKLLSWLLGPTFAVKLLENGEAEDQISYARLNQLEDMAQVIADEEKHEKELVGMIEEDKLNYMGSVVLGLNDALIELTGALAGLTFGLQDPSLIVLTGAITGIAAGLSMAASEYLSTKSEDAGKHAGKAAAYTGLAYFMTLAVLIVPFLLIHSVYLALVVTLFLAVCIIAGFNYYYAVVKDEKFKRRFAEMALISLSIAALSFGVGYLLRRFFGVDV